MSFNARSISRKNYDQTFNFISIHFKLNLEKQEACGMGRENGRPDKLGNCSWSWQNYDIKS